jgi:uncharacterized membrane protein
MAVLLLFQFATCLFILLDVPIARQFFGFIFFTVVPGYIIIKLLRLDNLGKAEMIVFSVGFSVAFLMLGGLLINELCPLIGISRPLSQMPLLVILNVFVLLGEILVFLRDRNVKLWAVRTADLSLPVLLVMVLPILSILGAVCVNAFGSNLILLILVAAIPLLLAVAVLASKSLPSRFYPLALLMISISLLFHSSLISKYLINFGSDISLEYSISEVTIEKAMWGPIGDPALGRFDSMLSITILPTIYLNLLGMSLTSIFKILYPLIFSLVPLGLYQLWQRSVGNKYAFIAVFLFMAQETFYSEMLGLARQMIAELFFVLLILLVSNMKIQASKKIICFAVFSAAIVISHYALALIFVFFIATTYAFLLITRRPSRNITLSMVLIFFVIMFSWYIYTSGSAAFKDILAYGDYVYSQLGQFLNPASRGSTVLRGLGIDSAPSVWNTISRVFAYLTELLIGIGFLGLITRKVTVRFEKEYFILSTIAMIFLGAVILVPGMAKTLNMTRFYHILLFFLAPLILSGATVICKLALRREKEFQVTLLLLFVLIPYFLFQTSFIYEITGSESWSLPLSGYRMSRYQLYYKLGYFSDKGFFGSQWIRKNLDYRSSQLHADRSSMPLLISYGAVPFGEVPLLTNGTSVLTNGTVFLDQLNVEYGIVVADYYVYPLDNLAFLSDVSKIYCNGGSEVYRNCTG